MSNTTSELPDFLTVEEAARVLRIGRTAAYALARTWRNTDGREGLPVVEFGRLLRVPRRVLEQMAGGSITTTAARKTEQVAAATKSVESPPPTARATRTRHRHKRQTSPDQPTLPLT